MNIYKTINKINGKVYIGQDTKDRPDYFGSGILIIRALAKYGKDSFDKEILEECCSREDLDDREIYWIKKFNSTDLSIGYNIATGGQNGSNTMINNPRYEEICRKMSISATVRQTGETNSFYGKHHSEEAKRRIAESRKGKTYEEIYGEKIGKGKKKKKSERAKGSDNSNYGNRMSKESKKKISIANTGRVGSMKGLFGEDNPRYKKVEIQIQRLIFKLYKNGNTMREVAAIVKLPYNKVREIIKSSDCVLWNRWNRNSK